MKKYLLIAGHAYYPQPGTEDWKGCFETYEQAYQAITEKQIYNTLTKGKNKGTQERVYVKWEYNGIEYDWYEIVDLDEWIK